MDHLLLDFTRMIKTVWINAKEKKPKEGEKVLAWGEPGDGLVWTDDCKHVIFDMYQNRKWVSGWNIKWWLPMPPPPEGETGRP